MLRDAMLRIKRAYPELAGIMMYGFDPRQGFHNASKMSTDATDRATFDLIRAANEMMRDLWPDPVPALRKLK